MKILVTGSEGSLMQAVIPKLLQNNHKVFGIDNLYRHNERRKEAESLPYEFHKQDLEDSVVTNAMIKEMQPDIIIQAAAKIYGVGGFNRFPADILGRDIAIHNNVLSGAVNANVPKVVYISSSMVYENCPQDIEIPVTEDMVENYPAPYTDYGLSKFTGERLSLAYQKQYGVKYTIWRPFNIITPYESADVETGISHVFADFINEIIIDKMKMLPIIGDGEQIRCFTWIDDVAQAIADYSIKLQSDNQIFNIGNPEPVTMKQLARLIAKKGVSEGFIKDSDLSFKTIKEYPNDVKVRIPSIKKIQETFKWSPTRTVEGSIRECLEYLKK